MSTNRTIEIFKNLYSDEYDEEEKDEAVETVLRDWHKFHKRISKQDLLRALNYALDILGK